MTTPRIYISSIEIRPKVGSIFDPGEVCGAAVRCFIPADTEAGARAILKTTIEEWHFELIEIEFCHPADGKWQKDDEGTDADGIKKTQQTSAVAFGRFYTWGYDAPDALEEA